MTKVIYWDAISHLYIRFCLMCFDIFRGSDDGSGKVVFLMFAFFVCHQCGGSIFMARKDRVKDKQEKKI